ncbi:MAG: DUF72 domain-containing protein [Pedobacter sp.]|nr:MAG: DUF72 domain-containing protein [Pedobacter sp.]
MEFGRVDAGAVSLIDHSLPANGESIKRVFPGKPAQVGCQFMVGCSKWGRKEWTGHLYPQTAKERDFLKHYARYFDSIELNATFFSLPERDRMEKWLEQVKESGNVDFLFVPRISRTISHIKRLRECEAELSEFIHAVEGFGSHLGPMLLQLSDNFGPKYFEPLKDFVENLPKNHHFFFELRHPEWFSNVIDRGRVFELFANNNVGVAMSDTSGRRDCLHMELTTRELFVRFVGHGDFNRSSDYARVDEWVERISELIELGLEKVYFFVHLHE